MLKHFYKLFRQWLRYDGYVILFYVLVLLVMTYPLIFKLGDIIPMDGTDIYPAMWQNWWIREVLTKGLNINHTHYLFFPEGLDVTLQPRRWTSYPIWAFLDALFGLPASYNITVLIQSLIKAYAMYRFLLLFVKSKRGAWLGGAFYAFSARMLASAIEKPNTGAMEFIPIFMIFFVLALRQIERTSKINIGNKQPAKVILLMIVSGLAFSANIYMNIKIGIFAVFIGGAYLVWVFLIRRLWKYPIFWVSMVVFTSVTLIISSPILIPALTYDGLNDAVDQYEPDVGLDMTLYLKADEDSPLFYNQWMASLDEDPMNQFYQRGLAYVGLPSIIVALLGALYVIRFRRDQLIWVILTVVFFLLSLGVVLKFNGNLYPEVPLPYQLLQSNFVFALLREPFRFILMFVFSFSILIAFGIQYRFNHVSSPLVNRWMFVFIAFIVLFQTSIFPIPFRDNNLSDAYRYIKSQPEGAIINIPIGRNQSKYYMYAQTLHEHPMVEGMTARTPEGSYDFWNDNLLLKAIKTNHLTSSNINRLNKLHENWKVTMDELLDMGFRYIVRTKEFNDWRLRRHDIPDYSEAIFGDSPAIFETERIVVYDISILRDNLILH